jgi:hypothetical protein
MESHLRPMHPDVGDGAARRDNFFAHLEGDGNAHRLDAVSTLRSPVIFADLRSSPHAGLKQRCGDVMIYAKITNIRLWKT